MKKRDLIKMLDELNIEKSEYFLISGTALVFYGIKESTDDLDICISSKMFEDFKDKYISKYKFDDHYVYQLTKNIDFIVRDVSNFTSIWKDGFQLENLDDILEFKLKRNKEKDVKDILKIKEYLANN